ncbi:DUF4116 domain-containing protein [Hylemonella gracilis]|nr:DUF4116 domain-containing protein [Hylemonella gracilis]
MDKTAALARVRADGYALARLDAVLRDDDDVVWQAVRVTGMALEFASERLRAAKPMVLAAVGQDALALVHAAEALRNDRDVVRAAMRSNFIVYALASRALREDEAFMLQLFRNEVRDQVLCGFMPQEIPELIAEALRERETRKMRALAEPQ